ncbi:type 1 glutamine amidotransferase family protein [Methanofollis fontis]|uniref:Glutamine amidotransferase domain-containing protein n=1 Tax=Methanofollis fontis TaxID=2052832 RepID=A0A483CRU8_9EURY|nr:hypothetical protein [Methanofollis fontis]TAJ43991.1 hypothetical protein CUJ86_08070 [Methanofollis fontis]
MITKATILWDQPGTFNRYVNECCNVCCDHATHHMIAAPFYRARTVALIVPTGFANSTYSSLLPGLRASSRRIRSFVEKGGRLLVFGAMDYRAGAYDWLPFAVEYHHEFKQRPLLFPEESGYASLIDGYDTSAVETDGYFRDYDADVVAETPDGEAVIISRTVGDGVVIVTATHEYPSVPFMGAFCTAERETLF